VERLDFEIVVKGTTGPGGGHHVQVQARMRDGSLRSLEDIFFHGGCPPASLDLISSSVDDEVQVAMLCAYGLQGTLNL
jgi:hypothetical protein